MERAKLGPNSRSLTTDLESHHLYESLASNSLFSDQNSVILNVESITLEELNLVKKLNSYSNSDIVAYGGKLDKSKIKYLEGIFESIECPLPNNKNSLMSLVRNYSKDHSVNLPSGSIDILYEKFGLEIDRYYNIVKLLNVGGMSNPTLKQIIYLAQDGNATLPPWDLFSLLNSNKFTTKVVEVGNMEFLPTLIYLLNRFTEIALIQDNPSFRNTLSPYTLKTLDPIIESIKEREIGFILTAFPELEKSYKEDNSEGLYRFELFLLKINQFLLNN
jgi:hypothetical protein